MKMETEPLQKLCKFEIWLVLVKWTYL